MGEFLITFFAIATVAVFVIFVALLAIVGIFMFSAVILAPFAWIYGLFNPPPPD